MKQVWISEKGAPETLQVRDAPDPQAGAGQLRIRVAFAGINFADIQARMGQYPDPRPSLVWWVTRSPASSIKSVMVWRVSVKATKC